MCVLLLTEMQHFCLKDSVYTSLVNGYKITICNQSTILLKMLNSDDDEFVILHLTPKLNVILILFPRLSELQ